MLTLQAIYILKNCTYINFIFQLYCYSTGYSPIYVCSKFSFICRTVREYVYLLCLVISREAAAHIMGQYYEPLDWNIVILTVAV